MEELRTYIESGILELYVLGDLSSEEREEVEAMAAKHPEVKAEIVEIEEVMGAIAAEGAIEPSENVKASFLSQINFTAEETISEEQTKVIEHRTSQSAPVNETAVLPINVKQLNFYKYSFAASFALLLLSVAALFVLYNNLQSSQQQLAIMQTSNNDFANKVNYLDNRIKSADETIAVYGDPDFKRVKLNGTDNSPASNMVVAFNPKAKKVMIDMKNMSMPKTDEEHQYQLWALVDGKPVDLGVFDADSTEFGLKNMKSLENAQAFAVTLEPRGGSINPTLDKMMVMGAI